MIENLGNSKESHGITPKTLSKNAEKTDLSPQKVSLGTQKPKKKRFCIKIYCSESERVRLRQIANNRGYGSEGLSLMFKEVAQDIKLLEKLDKFKELMKNYKELELLILTNEEKMR